MALSVGDKVLMQYSTLGDRLLSVVTEVREGDCIIVYSPLSDIAVDRLREHNLAVIKYVSEGLLKGLRTRVLGEVRRGDELVTLAYPEEVVTAEERKEPRCSCCFPAMLDVKGELFEAHVADMSRSAFRIRFHDPSSVINGELDGENVRLEFFIFEPANCYKVNCRVLKFFMKEYEKFAVLEIQDGEEIKDKIVQYVDGLCQGGYLNRF